MSHLAQSSFQPLRIAVLTVSDTRTLDTDTSGQTLISHLEEAGHALAARAIVIDDIYQIRAQLSQWIADALVQVVLITGGTGFIGGALARRLAELGAQVIIPTRDKSRIGGNGPIRYIAARDMAASLPGVSALFNLAYDFRRSAPENISLYAKTADA